MTAQPKKRICGEVSRLENETCMDDANGMHDEWHRVPFSSDDSVTCTILVGRCFEQQLELSTKMDRKQRTLCVITIETPWQMMISSHLVKLSGNHLGTSRKHLLSSTECKKIKMNEWMLVSAIGREMR